jgi:DNA-binding SARP family transcriptional activator
VLQTIHVIEFRILGPLEVTRDGTPVALGGPKQRALLAYLLLRRGEVVSTDRLVDELWGEQPPRTAITSLQNLVSQLRKSLGADVLATRPPGYVLHLGGAQLDLARFELLVAEACEGAPEERSRLLRDALALWRGPPLAEFAYEPFAEGEIGRLDELRLAATEELNDAELELGHHTQRVGALEQLVGTYPLRERLRGQLMLALYRSGRQAEALGTYQDARRALVAELGIEPSPALQALHASILRQETALTPALRPHADDDHYDEVVHALAAGRLVVVLGPGAGPQPLGDEIATRLADEFGCPAEHVRQLTRVSQYVAMTRGIGPLYDELHELLAAELEPPPVARALAALAGQLREREAPQQLLVTANYDRSVEAAFEEAGEELDVVSYIAAGRDRGRFLHVAGDGAATVIDLPNSYADVSPDRRTVVLKIHGQVDHTPDRAWESFVVSEDDYIDYLAATDIASVVPVTVAARLRRSHFLFLGYALADWSFRVFLHRIWRDERVRYRSWAVHPAVDSLEREFWRQRGIDVLDVPLADYVDGLRTRLDHVAAPAMTA